MRMADPPPGMPRWVKLFGIIVLVLVLLFVLSVVAGGQHGPGRHVSSGASVAGASPLGLVVRSA
jgi:hypothetical protein